MIDVKVDMAGGEELERQLKAAMDEAATDMAREIKSQADQDVPVDTGTLKRSGKVHESKRGKAEASVSYGGQRAPYAPVVHEVGDRKWLRDAAMRAKQLLGRASVALAKRFERGERGS